MALVRAVRGSLGPRRGPRRARTEERVDLEALERGRVVVGLERQLPQGIEAEAVHDGRAREVEVVLRERLGSTRVQNG